MKTKEYQEKLTLKLQQIFGHDNVKKEWNIAKESRDAIQFNWMYTPRVDIAIGPFNIDRRIEPNNIRINDSVSQYGQFVSQLNVDADKNPNPRCFIAIEIENQTGNKHIFGSILNAASLGKIGIIIPISDKATKAIKNIMEYIKLLKEAKKQNIVHSNVAIISPEKIDTIILTYIRQNERE